MEGKKLLHYQRSPSRASRVVCETLNSEKLVWLAPVSSPLLSPGRDKTQMLRRKPKQMSIFALPRRAKVSMEAEEPTSPKVSCIGQVRASKKSHGSFADSKTEKTQHYKPGSASPARFFTSPGRQLKWGSLFSTRKDGHYAASRTPGHYAASSTPGHCAGEASCFGFPGDSSSTFNPERSCGAFLAKSLILLQECGERAECSRSEVLEMHAHAHANEHEHAHTHSHANIHEHPHTHSHANAQEHAHPHAHNYLAETQSNLIVSVTDKETTHIHDTFNGKHAHEIPCSVFSRPIICTDSCDAQMHVPRADEHHQQETASGFTQKQMQEELPSLNLSAHRSQNLKISVDVVPETWICRDGENLMADTATPLIGVCVNAMDSGRDGVGEVRGEDTSTPLLCADGKFSPVTCDTTECGSTHLASSCKAEAFATELVAGNAQTCEHDLICDFFESEDSSCIFICKEDDRTFCNSKDVDGIHERGSEDCKLRQHEKEVDSSNVISNSLRIPQLVEKDLHCFHVGRRMDCVWDIHKGKITEARSAQAFSTLILLEYNLRENLVCFKDERKKGATCEVAKVSFHGAGRQVQWLKGEAEFSRSRSATSYRTVIQLQRCKSDPGRAY